MPGPARTGTSTHACALFGRGATLAMLHRHIIFFLGMHGHGLVTVSGGLGKLLSGASGHVRSAFSFLSLSHAIYITI